MKVLLVDDEIFTIRMLQNIIRWDDLGLELMGYAQDGQEALEKILKETPDIVITDIKMPVMSGLELLRKLNDLSLGVKTILVSAYADFSYVKEAMKQGGCDYILKPIDESELEMTLRKVMLEIQGLKEQEKLVDHSAKQLDKINLYHYMRTNHGLNRVLKSDRSILMDWKRFSVFLLQTDSKTIDEYNKSNNLEMLQGGYITKLVEYHLSKLFREFLIFDYEDGVWTLLLEEVPDPERDVIARNIIEMLFEETGIHVNVCFSSYGYELKELPALYEEVLSLSKYRFYIGEEDVLGYGYNCNKSELDEVRELGILKDIEMAILDRDTQRVCRVLNEAFKSAIINTPNEMKFINNLCLQTVRMLQKLIPEEYKSGKKYQELCKMDYEMIASSETLKVLKNKMLDIIEDIPELLGDKNAKSYTKPVEDGIRLIEEKYNQNLSLEEICAKIAISKNYFCYLFKRETGMSIWNFLTVIRLQHAKQLLENTDLKSYEIAFQVGYDNPSYFSKLFKKYELMTPNEFRERRR